MITEDLTELSQSKQIATRTIFAGFTALKEAGGELPRKELLEKIKSKLTFTEKETEVFESNGQPRWLTIFLFYTIDCRKAGFLRKEKGMWYLTKEGEEAMKLGPIQLLEAASAAYRKWAASNPEKKVKTTEKEDGVIEDDIEQTQKVNVELLQDQATVGIKEFINKKNPYEFQDLVAALLETMGHHISFVAPKGKDGGLDIIAFQDPLGIQKPRIKVQVKHFQHNTVGPDPIRSLKGLLNSTEEVGLFVTSGRFTEEAKKFAREANTHIRLIDGDELIDLWKSNYNRLSDENKNLLPLQPIYFLGSND
jgi:restriction system protein